MATTAAGTPYVESSDLVANYPGVSLALANHIDGLDGGKVLQVVQGVSTTATTIASTSLTDTGLSATITPRSASNKILVMVEQAATSSRSANTCSFSLAILRNSTVIYGNDQPYEEQLIVIGATSVNNRTRYNRKYLDSPSTTSPITYKTQAAVETTANAGQLVCQLGAIESIIILMEVAA